MQVVLSCLTSQPLLSRLALDREHLQPRHGMLQEEFEDPVRAADGRAYDRSAIEMWLTTHDTSPMTNEPMPHKRLVSDPELKQKMLDVIARLTALTGELGG